MPRNVSMETLVTSCQREADAEGDPVISPPEWKRWISQQYATLYSIVVQSGFRYFESAATITATGAASYPLPADHDSTIGIDRVLDGAGRVVSLGELMIAERDRLSAITGDASYYSLVGQSIVFYPNPSSGTYTHLYVAQSPDISSLGDASNVDVVTGDGEAFLIWSVTVRALGKLRRDPTLAITERAAAEARFTRDVGARALVNPRRRVVVPTPLHEEEVDW